MNQPPIPPAGLDPVIKRQLETSLHGQYAFAAKTVWMGWIFMLIPIGLAALAAHASFQNFQSGSPVHAWAFAAAAFVALIVAYGMWVSHQTQKKLSKQYQADMAGRFQG